MSTEYHVRPDSQQYVEAVNRRDFLTRAGGGFGALALSSLLDEDGFANDSATLPSPARLRTPHFAGRATSVIWCFLDGGPSHIDLFDPKPELNRLAGNPLPDGFKRPVTAMGRTAHTPLLECKRMWKQHGQAGTWVSDWYPEIAKCVDEISVIRSCTADGLQHVGSVCQMNTGSVRAGRPSLGAWSIYGLGTESQSLPGYVVLNDYDSSPPGGSRNWGTGFMPSAFQGTKFLPGDQPIEHLYPALGESGTRQEAKLRFIQQLNERHRKQRPEDDRLEARIASYELAFRMQAAAPDVVDLSGEGEETRQLYGLDQKETERGARNCILARRLVERGVRFVQVYFGSGSRWDAHSKMEENHGRYCHESDRPIAGLIKDLKKRGLLDSTLVVWGGEFGRTPMSESGDGRDHNPYGFTMFMAGGGIRGGITFGTTDEIGLYAIEDVVHVHDIHATILHCLGLDHLRLTYRHQGLDERATVNGGKVIQRILS